MEIISLPVKGFSSNCYIIHNGEEAFVVDPSASEYRIVRELKERAISLKGILLTHGHFDHIWRAQELRKLTGAPLYVHELDNEMITDTVKNAYRAFEGCCFTIKEADVLLHEGDTLFLGDEMITVLHTPGHTKGSVCYDTGEFLFTGDTVFAAGFGRCDLYGGNIAELRASISRLSEMAKNENRLIYCGHGESSTLRSAIDAIKYYF